MDCQKCKELEAQLKSERELLTRALAVLDRIRSENNTLQKGLDKLKGVK